jgi:hypothetical protein
VKVLCRGLCQVVVVNYPPDALCGLAGGARGLAGSELDGCGQGTVLDAHAGFHDRN